MVPKTLALLAVLFVTVSGCSNVRERLAVPHPPVADLAIAEWRADVAPGICTTEPPIPSEEALAADPLLETNWHQAMLESGRACRDALSRTCGWHVELGLKLPDGVFCSPVARHPDPG